MKVEVEYFDKAGGENTETCLKVVDNASNYYKDIVVASTSGDTGLKFAEKIGKKVNLVVVTHAFGTSEKNKSAISDDTKKKIKDLGAKVFTGTILTSSLEKSLASEFKGIYPTIIIAETLRRFGQGMKVCVEIVMEACDAGLIEEGKDVVAVAGTSSGADTICVIESSCSRRFMELKIKQILAKPKDF